MSGFAAAAGRAASFFRNRPILRKILIAFIAVACGIYFFLAMVALNLDEESARTRIIAAAREKAGVVLSIGDLGFSFPFTVRLRDAGIGGGLGAPQLKFSELYARLAVWRLFILSPMVKVGANEGNGTLALEFSTSAFSRVVRADIEADFFPLDRVIIAQGGALPLKADLYGNASFKIPRNSPAAMTGEADFELKNMVMKNGGGWASFLSGFSPKSALCAVSAKDGKLSTRQCALTSSAGTIELRATAALADNLLASRLEGALVVSPAGTLEKTIATLYPRNRKADGKYYFPIGGTLGSPSLNLN